MRRAHRRVVAVAYDRLCTFEFGLAVEVFGLPRPELDVPWYDFSVCSPERGPLRATGGFRVQAARGLRALDEAGTVVLPGWRDPEEAPPKALLEALVRAHARGARLLSICSGVFVLAATGLLDGLKATTHWRYTRRLAERFPRIEVTPDVLYVDNGQLLTSAGSAAGLDLCLHLVRRDYGAAVARTVARRLVVPPHREGGQAQYLPEPVALTEAAPTLSPVLDWALQRLDEPLSVPLLARRAHMSERTFSRRFQAFLGTSPAHWLTTQRVQAAQRLLEQTDLSMDEVAGRTGLGTAANMRHHFQAQVRTSPSRYRRAFQGPGEPALRPARRR
jgi:AraC family transcriptional activator FtrA